MEQAERLPLHEPADIRLAIPALADHGRPLYVEALARFGLCGKGDLSFCDRSPDSTWTDEQVGSLILCSEALRSELAARYPRAQVIVITDPRAVFIDFAAALAASSKLQQTDAIPRPYGIHPSAQIGRHTHIAAETRIDAGVVIGHNCSIRCGTWLGEGTLVRDNAVVGESGINAYTGTDGKCRGFPHLAGTIVGKNVQIGAGAVLMRGILTSTRIADNTVIGNLCNIGHGVQIDEGVWISVGSLVGGHTTIGKGANIAMGVSIRDNLSVGAGVQIGMGSVVVKSIAHHASVFGNPARAVPPLSAGPNR